MALGTAHLQPRPPRFPRFPFLPSPLPPFPKLPSPLPLLCLPFLKPFCPPALKLLAQSLVPRPKPPRAMAGVSRSPAGELLGWRGRP